MSSSIKLYDSKSYSIFGTFICKYNPAENIPLFCHLRMLFNIKWIDIEHRIMTHAYFYDVELLYQTQQPNRLVNYVKRSCVLCMHIWRAPTSASNPIDQKYQYTFEEQA